MLTWAAAWSAIKTLLIWLKDHPLEAIIGILGLLLGVESGRRKWAQRKQAQAEAGKEIATVEGELAVHDAQAEPIKQKIEQAAAAEAGAEPARAEAQKQAGDAVQDRKDALEEYRRSKR